MNQTRSYLRLAARRLAKVAPPKRQGSISGKGKLVLACLRRAVKKYRSPCGKRQGKALNGTTSSYNDCDVIIMIIMLHYSIICMIYCVIKYSSILPAMVVLHVPMLGAFTRS